MINIVDNHIVDVGINNNNLKSSEKLSTNNFNDFALNNVL